MREFLKKPRLNKWYVGQAADFRSDGSGYGVRNRVRDHSRSVGNHPGPFISAAIIENGIEAFDVVDLAWAPTPAELDELERHYIAEKNSVHPNGYNADSGGKSGYRRCEATLEKMRQPKEGPYPRHEACDQGLPKYLHRYQSERQEGWVAYFDGARRAFTTKKYAMDFKKEVARYYLDTGLIHPEYQPSEVEDLDPENCVSKSGDGFTAQFEGQKKYFTSCKYDSCDLKRYALHYRDTGETHLDYHLEDREINGFVLPSWIYSRFGLSSSWQHSNTASRPLPTESAMAASISRLLHTGTRSRASYTFSILLVSMAKPGASTITKPSSMASPSSLRAPCISF